MPMAEETSFQDLQIHDNQLGSKINDAACKIAREVANEGDAMVAGGICQTPTYLTTMDKEKTKAEFRKQMKVFVDNGVDFIIAEYYEHVEEAVWAVETIKEYNVPVAANLCIGPEGDMHGVSPGDCAVKLVNAGAEIVGVNCHFDPPTSIETVRLMKEGLDKAGLKAHLMVQPLGFMTPDCGKQGFIDLPEFPFGLEPRIITRWDAHKFARDAYNVGIRYIGGCCGFEPYHIRAVAEELAPERGYHPTGSEKHDPWGQGLRLHTKPWVRARAHRDYWENLKPSSGRPFSAALSTPCNWGVTAGDELLQQHKSETSVEEMKNLIKRNQVKDSNVVNDTPEVFN
ncbi:Betaine--homocysteine S-methyltransferase 1 [Holothuria leucospilota]|uniref:Betaine--homocysteine S-methyltransferase 1 n=1 Tax=Holothuria leucospilota TaxID=206669 RepID=A0A9Q1H1I4_HOLLE|nr:Betaine--homocysteine S-methyltransferase 1 [Holothuria leucospilota]